jgi:hypothetical protein
MPEAINTGPPLGPSKADIIKKGAKGPTKKRPAIESNSETSKTSEEQETQKIIIHSQVTGIEIHETNDEDGEKCDKRPKMDLSPPSILKVMPKDYPPKPPTKI